MKKHFFFDMDGTLTRSKSLMTAEMLDALGKLEGDIIIVSGATLEQIEKQVPVPSYKLSQNGNEAFTPVRALLWRKKLTVAEIAEIVSWVNKILLTMSVSPEDLIQYRGAQISFSLVGHNAPREEKERFDPDGSRRKAILMEFPFLSDSVEVVIGGTTSFDFFHKGSNKGANVAKLIQRKGWDKDECVYFGDALYSGGNDESVVGVIDTVAVSSPEETLNKLKEYGTVSP